ncbi:MAG: aminotransferase class I/II-fold pyridoxal phosphate-dependent enzyme [Lachnospiraceae bacterium]|nr:aminotransferase class I/II-fold pyridoxal phosphate-dependent enzyme [Lachnospiraceae bacterium]
MNVNKDYGFSTLGIHAGEEADQYGALIPPIYQTSTFSFKTTDDAAAACDHLEKGFAYSRITNPSLDFFERKLAALEHGAGAVAFASGVGAISAGFLTVLSSGDHIVASKAAYSATHHLLTSLLPRLGITSTLVDTSNLKAVEAAIKPNTKLIYFETPANPTMLLTDIEGIVAIAKANKLMTAVDNTFASPYVTNPLDFGVDYVVQSCTKYICGHGDVIAGALITKNTELLKDFRLEGLMHIGAVMAPNTAFLLTRGLKTLEIRMQRHISNAQKLAEFLESQENIVKVNYPGLPSNPQYELAKRQMNGGGGVITFEVAGGLEGGKAFMNSLNLCKIAVSLGDCETLIEQPASMTHTMVSPKDRLSADITDGLIRISVGLENIDDIIGDIKQALEKGKLSIKN